MARQQDSADRRIERAILVLGLVGVVAIFVPFTAGLSPLAALPVLRVLGSSMPALDVFAKIVSTTAALAFFLAPLVSLAQWSRCLGRPCSVWERGLQTAAASRQDPGRHPKRRKEESDSRKRTRTAAQLKLAKAMPHPPPIYGATSNRDVTECKLCNVTGKIGGTKCHRCDGVGQREVSEPPELYRRRMYTAAIAHQLKSTVVVALIGAETRKGGYTSQQLKELKKIAHPAQSAESVTGAIKVLG